MAASTDGNRAKVDGQHVECCFRSAEDGPSELGGVAIGFTGFHDFGEESGCRCFKEPELESRQSPVPLVHPVANPPKLASSLIKFLFKQLRSNGHGNQFHPQSSRFRNPSGLTAWIKCAHICVCVQRSNFRTLSSEAPGLRRMRGE